MTVIEDLIKTLNEANLAYEAGKPTMTDKEYDDLYFELKKLEKESGIIYPDSPTQNLNYEIMSQLTKVRHNHLMLSLDKTKDWNEFINYFERNKLMVCMLKLDGLTCSLRYENGKLVSAETRGNGQEGEDILHNAKVVYNIPQQIKYQDTLIVDGEIISTINNFERFKDKYSNPRNFAAGSIRLLDSKECANRGLMFVAWNVVEGFDDIESFASRLINLNENGFSVVPFNITVNDSTQDTLKLRAKELGYPIDGLVGRYDDVAYGNSLGTTGHHIKAAYAFKFYDETYETKLKNIEWTMGRTGTLTPVAIVEPIEIEGAIIERCNLHNISIGREQLGEHPFEGQVVHIYRANQIIPQIDSADNDDEDEEFYTDKKVFSPPTTCPYCGQPTQVKYGINTTELYCDNPNCDGKTINQLDHLLGIKGLNAKGISKANLEKLISYGWIEKPADLYNLHTHRKEWIEKRGYGIKSVDKILNAIESTRQTTLDSFIAAIGIPLIGHNVAKELVKYIDSYEDFREKVDSGYDFSKIYGFGANKDAAIHNFNYTNADELYKYITIIKEEPVEVGNNLSDLNVAITGKLTIFNNRAELENEIIKQGGKISKSITGKTTLLINNDNTSTTAKNKEAQERGIPIITEEEFITRYLKQFS